MCVPDQPPAGAARPAPDPASGQGGADAPGGASGPDPVNGPGGAVGASPGHPSSAADAMAMAEAGLAFLASADAGSMPAAAQAECLLALERAGSMHVAARARVLLAFVGQRGFEGDGQGSAGAWLRWQTRITRGAAAGAVAWARRLAAHPAVGGALAAGEISASWAREICGWTERLPADHRADADEVLLAAAAGGAELADLAALAEEIHRRCAPPDGGDDDGFADRWLRLDRTFRNAGRVDGDLTPQCAAALQAVLEALGRKAGPEDDRTKGQRDHDALEEACRRLIGAECLPDRAGQSTQIQLHMTLDQLRGLTGAPDAEAAWAARGPAAAPGSECDASFVPVVSGHVDPAVLDKLIAALRGENLPQPGHGHEVPGHDERRHDTAGHDGPGRGHGQLARGLRPPGGPQPERGVLRSALPAFPGVRPSPWLSRLPGTAPSADDCLAAAAVRALVLRHAADLLSGPAGLAAFLRTGLLAGAAGAISLPLDTGRATEQIPAHLRRAVIARDRCCAFPGCSQPPAACQVHHIRPRRKGGRTALPNLILLCPFHHLTAVHRWGWAITLHPDGTVTALSPDRQRTLHSHDPCRQHSYGHGPAAAGAA